MAKYEAQVKMAIQSQLGNFRPLECLYCDRISIIL